MRTFHFLDAVCLFVVAAFILLETDASPKLSNTKLKNKGPVGSGNAEQKKNSGLTPGNRWHSDASAKCLTLSKPNQVEYRENCGARSVRAEQPIPKIKSGIFYYEVEILARKWSNPIYIGLGPTKGMSPVKELGISEGYAYSCIGEFWGHEFMGCRYSKFTKRPYVDGQPPFGVRELVPDVVNGGDIRVFIIGDVIGCGVDLKSRQIIYTLNGVLLNTTGLLVDSDADLFPSVSLGGTGTKIEANFGSKDFKFNINNLI